METCDTPHEGEVFQFDPGDPVHHQVLGNLTLNRYRPDIDAQWVDELNRDIIEGSGPLSPSVSTQKQVQAVLDARARISTRLGINDPEHPIHDKNRHYCNIRRTGHLPSRFFGTQLALHEITGNAVTAIEKHGILIGMDGNSIRRNFNFISRMVGRLGWEGDARALVKAYPDMILQGSKKVSLLARLAIAYGNEQDKTRSNMEVAAFFRSKESVEAHMIPFATKEKYVLGDTFTRREMASMGKDREDILYENIGDVGDMSDADRAIWKAYFRYRKPSKSTIRQHPAIVPHLAAKLAEPPIKVPKRMPPVVTGEERWLTSLKIPESESRRKGWLHTFNKAIFVGSHRLNNYRPGSEYYEMVMAAREKVCHMLGWLKPSHDAYRSFHAFWEAHEPIASAERIIHILSLFQEHGHPDPLRAIEQDFGILRTDKSDLFGKTRRITRETLEALERDSQLHVA